jgi:hypothetical protein
MFARLVLVGLVAALGVTLPSRLECDRWMSSAQNWACRVLADWDTWKPRESDAYCLPPDRQSTASNTGRFVRVERIGAGRLESSERQRNVQVTISTTDEKATTCQRVVEGKDGWSPVVSSDHLELAMIVELYRIAEETQIQHPRATRQPDVGPLFQSAAPRASAQSAPSQTLPSEVFAPVYPSNEIEIVQTPMLPADVFAPAETLTEVAPRIVVVQDLPAQVFAPAEPPAEVQTTIVQLLPNEVFAPAAHGSDLPVIPINSHNLGGEKVATTSQPAAPGVEPAEEIGLVDPDLDGFCAIASGLLPDSEQLAIQSVGLNKNSSSQPEFTSIEPGPELDQGIETDEDRAGEGNETGSYTSREWDQAVSLTRDAMRAWVHAFVSSGQLKVTTR